MRQRRRGPKIPFARMERAVELKFLGFKWGEIERATNTPHSTLMRWYATEEWKAMEAEWLAHDPLLRQARAVLSNALKYELLKKGRPDTSLAERIFAQRGNGDIRGGYAAHPGIVILPMEDHGLKSRPATEVLLDLPAAAQLAGRPPETQRSGKGMAAPTRRRAAGPDEE